MNTINGMRISIAAAHPKMQVSREFARIQSPELVEKTNAWMAEFFGYVDSVPDGTVYTMEHMGVMVMNQSTYDKLRVALAKGEA